MNELKQDLLSNNVYEILSHTFVLKKMHLFTFLFKKKLMRISIESLEPLKKM